MILSETEFESKVLTEPEFKSKLAAYREQQAQKSMQRKLSEVHFKVLSELEKYGRVAVRYFVSKGLDVAVVNLLVIKKVRLVGDDENKFVEVVQ
jgi:hypothetical protein